MREVRRNKAAMARARHAGHQIYQQMQSGSPAWTRTTNILVNSQALCQLSYRGMEGRPAGSRDRPLVYTIRERLLSI